MLALGLGALTGRGKTKGKGRGARTAKVLVFALLGLLLLGLWTGSNGDGEEAGEVQRYELGSGAGSFEGKGAQTSKGGLGLGLGRFRPSLSLPYASWSGSSSSGGGSPGTLEDPYTPHPDTPYTAPSNAHRRLIDVASDPLPASATLEERLRAWEDAPGGRGEVRGEVEVGGFVQWNQEVGVSFSLTYIPVLLSPFRSIRRSACTTRDPADPHRRAPSPRKKTTPT